MLSSPGINLSQFNSSNSNNNSKMCDNYSWDVSILIEFISLHEEIIT